MASFWYSATGFKKVEDNLFKEHDRLSVAWPKVLEEAHYENSFSEHFKIVKKAGKNAIQCEQKLIKGTKSLAGRFTTELCDKTKLIAIMQDTKRVVEVAGEVASSTFDNGDHTASLAAKVLHKDSSTTLSLLAHELINTGDMNVKLWTDATFDMAAPEKFTLDNQWSAGNKEFDAGVRLSYANADKAIKQLQFEGHYKHTDDQTFWFFLNKTAMNATFGTTFKHAAWGGLNWITSLAAVYDHNNKQLTKTPFGFRIGHDVTLAPGFTARLSSNLCRQATFNYQVQYTMDQWTAMFHGHYYGGCKEPKEQPQRTETGFVLTYTCA